MSADIDDNNSISDEREESTTTTATTTTTMTTTSMKEELKASWDFLEKELENFQKICQELEAREFSTITSY